MADLDWWNVRPCGLSGAPDCASWCTEAASGPSEPEPAHAQLLISASPPFSILNATEAWCQLTGYSAESVFGRPVALLHGPLTCPETLAALTIAMSLGRSLRVVLVSYTSTGAPFLNCVDSRPVLDASGNPAVFQWDISPQPAALNSGVYPSPPAVAAAPSAAPPATNLAPSPYGSAPLPESHNGKANRSSQPPPLPHPDEGQFSDLGSDMSSLSHLWSAEADGQQTADADQPPASSSSAAAAAAGSTSREQLALQAARLVSDAQAHFAQAHQHEGVYAFAARPLTPNGSLQGGSQLGGSHLGGSHLGGSQLGGSQMGGSQLGLSDLLGSESDGPAAASPGMAPPHDPSLGGPRWALPPSVGSLRSFTGARGGMPTGPASTHMGAHGGLAGRGKHDMGAGGLGGAGYGQPHAPGMHGFGIDAGSLCALALGAPPLSLATAVAQALAIPAACSADRQPAGGGDRRPHATPAAVPFHDETESEHLAGIAASYGGFGGLLAQGGLGGGPAGARSGYGTPAAAIGFGERNEQRMTGQYTPRIASADAGIPQGGPSYQPCHAGSSALGLAAAVTRPSSGAPTAAPSALGKRAAAADTSDVWSTQAGDSKRARRKQGPRAAPFVQKLYKMASSPETDIAICWSHSGHSFWMRRPDLMEAVVLPQYFKHNRLTFFGKQLRAYGFKQRMAPSYLDMVREWYHTSGHFSRGGAAQLPLIQRGRPNIPPAPTPTGGTGQAPGAGGGAAASGATCKLEGGDSGGDASHGGSSDALSIPDSDSNAGSDSGGSHSKASANSGQASNSTKLSTSSLGSSNATDPSGTSATTAPAPSVPSPTEEATSGDGSDPDTSRCVSPSALQEQVSALNARVESHRANLAEQRSLILSRLERIAASLRAKGLANFGPAGAPSANTPAPTVTVPLAAVPFTAKPGA